MAADTGDVRCYVPFAPGLAEHFVVTAYSIKLRLSENAHLLRYPNPSSLRRTSMHASLLGISEALHLDIFHHPQRNRFFESLVYNPKSMNGDGKEKR